MQNENRKIIKQIIFLLILALIAFGFVGVLGKENKSPSIKKDIYSLKIYDDCNPVTPLIDLCYRSVGPEYDYFGTDTVVNYYRFDKDKNTRTLMYSEKGWPREIFGHSNSSVYLRAASYEWVGPGAVMVLDMNIGSSTELDINVYGQVSPDGKYYITHGYTDDMKPKNCNDSEFPTAYTSGNAIKILNFETGQIQTLISDKNLLFVVNKWSSESDSVSYYKYKFIEKDDSNRCRILDSREEGILKI